MKEKRKKGLKLSRRMLASSIISILGFCSVGLLGGYTIYSQNKATEVALRVSQSRADSARMAQAAILIMGKAEAQLISDSSSADRRKAAVLAIHASSTLDESIQRLQQELLGSDKVSALSRLLDEIEPAKMGVIRAVSVNDIASAKVELQSMQEDMDRVESISGEIVEDENRRLLAAVVHQGQGAKSTLRVLCGLVMGCGILGAAFARRIHKQQMMLELERKMLRTLIDNIPDLMYVKDADGRFVVANLQVAHAAGMDDPEELLGKTDLDCFPPELAKAFHEDDRRVMHSEQPSFNREVTGLDRAKNHIHILTTTVPLRDSKGQVCGVAGVGRDISERQKIEVELREAERKYRGIFDEAIVGIFQSTPDGRFLSANPAMARIFGFESPQAMVDGAAGITRQLFTNPERFDQFQQAMEKLGSVQNFESEISRNDGGKIWFAASCRAIRENGMVVRYEGMAEDISDRKVLQDQLLQSQKLESVGQLAAGIAHEINTPIQFIGDNLHFLKDAFTDLTLVLTFCRGVLEASKSTLSPETAQAFAGVIERADPEYLLEEIPKAIEQAAEGVGRVAVLVSAMKEFSHPGTKEKTPLDLNHAIESTITVSRNEWKYVAELETDFDKTMPLISCQPGQFNQVILNLIVNASHAIADVAKKGGPERGKITVQTRNCPEWVEIRIQDTGGGIPENVRLRIFDPFFTTKEIGKGTGQGLAIARSVVVDKHEGTIQFETEEGKGTTFIVRFPHDGKALSAKA